MKTLLILRHAKSSWSNMRLSDHDRPLNDRGRRDAPRMGQLLLDEDLVPDLIITSSAERALTTAELVALECGFEAELLATRDLYHAGPEEYLDVLREQGGLAQMVMVVGHNPGIEELVDVLTGEDERMVTAALAQVSLPIDAWSDMDLDVMGTLENVWRPKELH